VNEWRGIERWDVNSAKAVKLNLTGSKYPVVKVGDIVDYTQYGTSEKAVNDKKGIPILRMNNIIFCIYPSKFG
jgi:co-chaperonin GroES (HSP10)